MNFSHKLKKARKLKGLNQRELALALVREGRKASPQQISNWEKGTYSPSGKNLQALCKVLGVGMECFQDDSADSAGNVLGFDQGEGVPGQFSMVEKKKGAISAGTGLIASNEMDFQLAFRNDWLEKFGGVRQLFVMRVEGDSMEPTLVENDIVLINKNEITVGPGGGIFAIKWGELLLVKRLQLNPSSGKISIISDNSKYRATTESQDAFKIEGRVIWFGRETR
ncbi:MAG: helix-turn-helix domain-containing protein [Candidatus Nitronauta litoralis]|uniref:Helix-turn-helix domain-containing protein n=1 Tax=Candidatus Nitronauta litoralis TaxID=2705533 RepID=A0A7T0BVL6_9BACT|nr:MAG: helix-turn-helix domain-containing protein [Candidatus Nitronauta litoralis]